MCPAGACCRLPLVSLINLERWLTDDPNPLPSAPDTFHDTGYMPDSIQRFESDLNFPQFPSHVALDSPAVTYHSRLLANNARAAKPIWAITPSYCDPTCDTDRLLLKLVQDLRAAHSGDGDGDGWEEAKEASFPSANSLLDSMKVDVCRPLASAIARHLVGEIMVSSLPESAAVSPSPPKGD